MTAPRDSATVMAAALATLLAACGPAVDARDAPAQQPTVDAGVPCTVEGERVCRGGNESHVCHDGILTVDAVCEHQCVDGLGCSACVPGASSGFCDGDVARVCATDGSGWVDQHCDPLQGMQCMSGQCTGGCAPQNLGTSYVGCDYFPTVTGNMVLDGASTFAVAVSNTTDETASIHIDGGALPEPVTFDVPPGGVHVQPLPWPAKLKSCASVFMGACMPGDSALVRRGAYRLRATAPVTVHQFNPLEYLRDGEYTFTNDASLLLPATALTGSYRVASAKTWLTIPGLLAVTATADDTEVTITPRAWTDAGDGVPATGPTEPLTIELDAGDVVQLLSTSGDFTGSAVTATRPVQVIGGHYCTNVPEFTPACDHLEEVMFPVETLGRHYLLASPRTPLAPDGAPHRVRIIATAPQTTLQYDPPQPGAPTELIYPGDSIELAMVAGALAIESSRRVLVVQYMHGQGDDDEFDLPEEAGTGDPSMALAVPVAQYRDDYLIHVPETYEVSYATVTAALGVRVSIDGATEVEMSTPIGDSGFGVARVELPGGNHRLTATDPFGVSIYGYGRYTSYWYPGGLDLEPIDIE